MDSTECGFVLVAHFNRKDSIKKERKERVVTRIEVRWSNPSTLSQYFLGQKIRPSEQALSLANQIRCSFSTFHK